MITANVVATRRTIQQTLWHTGPKNSLDMTHQTPPTPLASAALVSRRELQADLPAFWHSQLDATSTWTLEKKATYLKNQSRMTACGWDLIQSDPEWGHRISFVHGHGSQVDSAKDGLHLELASRWQTRELITDYDARAKFDDSVRIDRTHWDCASLSLQSSIESPVRLLAPVQDAIVHLFKKTGGGSSIGAVTLQCGRGRGHCSYCTPILGDSSSLYILHSLD